MRWLIYGSRGWIGGQVINLLTQMNETVIEAQSRANDYLSTYHEIDLTKPDRIMCLIGRTYGQGCPNIDYLEQPGKLVENLRDNLHGPINLATICQKLDIHLTYLGTGCIYEFDEHHPMKSMEGHGYTEEDVPNFVGSQYSVVKGMTDQLIRQFRTTLNVRIRMPISADRHPRNFITKITQYRQVISIPNSMTVLPELLPIMIDMAKHKLTGSINLTNPGAMSHREILELYQQYVDPSFKFTVIDLSELSKYVVGKRSNNYLETSKLEKYYPHVKPLRESLIDVFKNMK